LRSLDLGGEYRFLANVGVEEQVRIRQDARDPVEAAEGEQRRVQAGTNAFTVSPATVVVS
jgi:hypothetical protein